MRSSGPSSAGAFGALLRPRAAVLAISLLIISCGTETSVPTREGTDLALEMQILDRVNGYRCGENLSELSWDETLAEIARVHAERLAAGYPLGHGCFEYRALLAEGILGGGVLRENVGRVAVSRHIASEFLSAWLLSPGHCRVMRSQSSRSGVGVARSRDGYVYAVQLFFHQTGYDLEDIARMDLHNRSL